MTEFIDPTTPMSFDLSELSCPVTIVDKKGVVHNCILVEASAPLGDEYRNQAAKQVKLGPKGQFQGITGLGEGAKLLVQGCLYQLSEDGTRTPVTSEFISSFGDRVIQSLYKRARNLSGMQDEEDTGKN